MSQKMTWDEMKKSYPDEWVALVDYEEDDRVDIEGVVVAHHPNRKTFHEMVSNLLPKYGDMSIRFTGPLVKNPEIPLLWQITDTG